MMRSKTLITCTSFAFLLVVNTASAHHSFAAEFDATKPVTLKGKVTKVELINPHGWLYVDAVGPDGVMANWRVETNGPNALLRRGWRKDSVAIGFDVVVQGYLARDGSHTANGTSVMLPDGSKLFVGSSGSPGDPSAPAKPN
jgi:hypothetical protein